MQSMTKQYNAKPHWDKIVSRLITAQGEEMLHGETYLFLTHQDKDQPAPDKLAATITTLFMGTQLQCAQCHVHPVYKEWGQKDFWGIAAYFAHTRADRPGANKKNTLPATITDVGQPMGGAKGAAKKGKTIAAN